MICRPMKTRQKSAKILQMLCVRIAPNAMPDQIRLRKTLRSSPFPRRHRVPTPRPPFNPSISRPQMRIFNQKLIGCCRLGEHYDT